MLLCGCKQESPKTRRKAGAHGRYKKALQKAGCHPGMSAIDHSPPFGGHGPRNASGRTPGHLTGYRLPKSGAVQTARSDLQRMHRQRCGTIRRKHHRSCSLRLRKLQRCLRSAPDPHSRLPESGSHRLLRQSDAQLPDDHQRSLQRLS